MARQGFVLSYHADVVYRAYVDAENEDEAEEKGNTAEWEESFCDVYDCDIEEICDEGENTSQ